MDDLSVMEQYETVFNNLQCCFFVNIKLRVVNEFSRLIEYVKIRGLLIMKSR